MVAVRLAVCTGCVTAVVVSDTAFVTGVTVLATVCVTADVAFSTAFVTGAAASAPPCTTGAATFDMVLTPVGELCLR